MYCIYMYMYMYMCIYMYNYAHTYIVRTCGLFLLPAVPGQASVSVDSTTATTISLSWSVPSGSVVDSYEVMWTSEECSDDVDEGSATITDGSTSHTIESLREGSSYTITVTATNSAGTAPSDSETAETQAMSERFVALSYGIVHGMYVYVYSCVYIYSLQLRLLLPHQLMCPVPLTASLSSGGQ